MVNAITEFNVVSQPVPVKMSDSHIVEKIVKCYLKGSLLFSLETQEAMAMNWDSQKMFLDATIHSQLLKDYPVNNEFSKLFFKKLISFIEPHLEVHDDCYSFLCSAMKNKSLDTFCYRHYIINNNTSNVITIKETNNMVVNGTTGMRTWEAALMLADWALSSKTLFENKKILELGSGVGFTGITIAKQCKIKSIVLTDCHNEVLGTITKNISINFPDVNHDNGIATDHLKLETMMLDWNEVADIPNRLAPDILIGADIVYDPSILQPLCNVIHSFFDKNINLEVYIASAIRNAETFDSFLQTLESNNLKYFKLTHVKSTFVDWDNTNNQMCLLKIIKYVC